LTQAEISKTVEFCFRAFAHVPLEQKEALVEKLKKLSLDADANDEHTKQALAALEKDLTPEELQILNTLRGRRMLRAEDSLNIDNFSLDSIDGMAPRLEQGKLGLISARRAEIKYTSRDYTSFLNGEAKVREKMGAEQAKEMNGSHAVKSPNESNGVKYVNRSTTKHSAATNGSSVGDFLAPLNGTGASLDEASRHTRMSALHEAAENLETPYDTMLRFANAVSYPANISIYSC
jgi:hypothetical protein